MTSFRLLAAVLAVALIDAADPTAVQVSLVVREGHVWVSGAATDSLYDELDEVIQSGLTTSFAYEAELRRPVGLWFDRVLSSSTVTLAVQLDTLTGRYQLTRSVDGRLDETKVTDDKAVVKRFVTAFERQPLFGTGDLEPNVEYYVKVRVRTRPRVTWFYWPWDRAAASGVARFTFIP
jgi:hypothetical protein